MLIFCSKGIESLRAPTRGTSSSTHIVATNGKATSTLAKVSKVVTDSLKSSDGPQTGPRIEVGSQSFQNNSYYVIVVKMHYSFDEDSETKNGSS